MFMQITEGKRLILVVGSLPVQFSSIKAEHEAVRTKAGLFDVSHMGEIIRNRNR